jgi:copper resistance protein D
VVSFIDIFGYLAVLLRALTLALGTIAVGGVIFGSIVLRKEVSAGASGLRSIRWLIIAAALGLATTQAFYLAANSKILTDTAGITLADEVGASYFIWGCLSIISALSLSALTRASGGNRLVAPVCSAAILCSTVATSHAAARLDHRAVLTFLTGAHQTATAAWIGGLPFLLVALTATENTSQAFVICRRFSTLALTSVVVLFTAGLLLARFYVGSSEAIYGTTYGLMLASKVVLFGMILIIGRFNYRIVRQLQRGDATPLSRLKRFSEAEIGIGITAILAAASLTSQPPGVDLPRDRVSLSTIADRVAPRWPLLKTPPLSSLSPSTLELWKQQHVATSGAAQAFVPGQEPYTPPKKGDIEWSEYNHHWAGVVVLIIGVLAMLSRFGQMRWARQWPLAFLGLAAFLLLRADPENWPLGPNGFWESFSSSDVAQHRLFVIPIVLFAAFERRVQAEQSPSGKTAYVFPLVCALGGAMLLTHTHGLTNVKEQVLGELSHAPIALLAVIAGWSRWLELRLSADQLNVAGRIWPVCFALIGVVLLLYREA